MNSTELKRRAQQLSDKTNTETISPTEVGGIMYDTVEYMESVERNGGSLGIRKTYESILAMEADNDPRDDIDGAPLRRGMLVNIYNKDNESAPDNGKVFSWQNPGWEFRGRMSVDVESLVDRAEMAAKQAEEYAGQVEEAAIVIDEAKKATQEVKDAGIYAKEQGDLASELLKNGLKFMPVNTIMQTTNEAGNIFGEDWVPCNGRRLLSIDYPNLKSAIKYSGTTINQNFTNTGISYVYFLNGYYFELSINTNEQPLNSWTLRKSIDLIKWDLIQDSNIPLDSLHCILIYNYNFV